MPDYGNDQLMALMEMGDIGGLEKKQAQQQAMANALRAGAMQPSSSKNWTAQLSRGLQGVGGLMGQRRADQMLGAPGTGAAGSEGAMAMPGTVMGEKQRALQRVRGILSPQKKPLTAADDPSLAYSGQGGGMDPYGE